MKILNYCLDCNKLISKYSKRCKSCSNHNRKGKYSVTTSKEHLGSGHGNWKGNKAKLIAQHIWIRKNKPKPKLCEICHIEPPFDVANKSGEYKRDIKDYKWLCRSCHMKIDKRMFNRNRLGRFKKC